MPTQPQPETSQNRSKPSYVKDLVLLFSVPLAIALIAGAVTFIPRSMAHPAYSFIYSYCDDYACDATYSLSGDRIVKDLPSAQDAIYNRAPQLVLYDPAAGSSRTLTYDEAQAYRMINSSKSPDGYTLVHATSDGGFLFWGNYQDNWQLENGLKKKVVRLSAQNDQYGSGDIKFIGWVQK